ncbi:two-component sensor histidine kinase [Parazoarcus communis]|uniref:histidine kinase n=2 Tax=Parazoarcus communis TaxID=41977 RepID=A0A2U8H6K3_9RHOO|nr:two-component sensor histidine kinase [Parazoarcus communis]
MSARPRALRMNEWLARFSLRAKLIGLFVAIKVIPLLLLAWFAWTAARDLGQSVTDGAESMADAMRDTQQRTARTAIDDSIAALDDRSREAIETLTTNTARVVARFLYDRDKDVLRAASLPTQSDEYRRFITTHVREFEGHGPYRPTADGRAWEPSEQITRAPTQVRAPLPDNATNFHYREPEITGRMRTRPLFLEITFIGLDGKEQLKAVADTATDLLTTELRDVSRREHTFLRAETYWRELQALKPGEIHVSDVVGEQVRTDWIGPYTPEVAARKGQAFAPEHSGYAGLENPVGKRFRGLIRWATPVERDGQIIGYVTLALDHAHLMAFTDSLRPTPERRSTIADPASGNYAFMWDHLGRSISHPRDYFIAGHDALTGERPAPWLDTELYAQWEQSGLPWEAFAADIPPYRDQRISREPHPESTATGLVALDCRYLNFSPQCSGWNDLTAHGGSGSFVIVFSGLQKLTTAAAIPYYTGRFGNSPRGFGFITIGANVEDFHRAATASAERIGAMTAESDGIMALQRDSLMSEIRTSLQRTAAGLSLSTALMIVAVVLIAIWMANLLSSRITRVVAGIRRFREGDLAHRLDVRGHDEMAQLAQSFNQMADAVQASFTRLDEARKTAEQANRMKSEFIAGMSHELRTPLNGIIGFADLLSIELRDDEQRSHAELIRDSGHQLLERLNDVLDLATIEAGRLEMRPEHIDFCELLRSVISLHAMSAAAKGLSLHAELPQQCSIKADPLRLRQVVNNLLSNAIKFTPSGDVWLTLENTPDWITLSIRDSGIGIPPGDLESIFEPFQRTENFLTRTQSGTGLGLSLAKKVVRLMGGRIEASSEEGVGSCFRTILPARASLNTDQETA